MLRLPYKVFWRPAGLLGTLCPKFVRRTGTLAAAAVIGFITFFGFRWFNKRNDPGTPEDEELPINTSVEVIVERPPETTTGETAADPREDPVTTLKRKRTEEDDDDDEEEEEDFDGSRYEVEQTDELYCEYDSTWETSWTSQSQRVDRPTVSHYHKLGRFRNAARDMQNYRHDYPQNSMYRRFNQEVCGMPNLEFYRGERPSAPDRIFITDFHSDKWFGNYNKLERVHTFIQWLFPLQEPGVNYEAKELTKEEIKAFRRDETATSNLLTSYKLMLDFYGIELSDEKTGEVKRARNWEERFVNLDRNTHNNLRITRVLKCLGTLGFRNYQAPLVRFFLEETLVHGNLPNVKESVLNYFLFAVRDKTKRRHLLKFAYLNYEPKEEFVWCPKKIQMIWSMKAGIPSSNQPMEMMTQDNKSSVEDNLFTQEWKPAEPEDEVGQEASECDSISPNQILWSTPGRYLGDSSLDVENQMCDDPSQGLTDKVDLPSTLIQVSKSAEPEDEVGREVSLSDSSLDVENQMCDDPSQGLTDKVDLPSTLIQVSKSAEPEDEVGREVSLSDSSLDVENQMCDDPSQGLTDKVDLPSTLIQVSKSAEPEDEVGREVSLSDSSLDVENQMCDDPSQGLTDKVDLFSTSTSGDDQTAEKKPGGEEESMEVSLGQIDANEESHVEEGQSSQKGQ